ncbi:MAG: bifunctional folylpolyglutamate synthase/dihydrofolate synthase [Clostridia bacterium]|nr:bifunctional folylpolyglutamate synthase/dihydrofolate synthase [Clostridia bacterium]
MSNFKEYANSFQAKSRLGLESIGELCEKCQNPQKKLKFVHVAGTNGKGSTCAFLQCILSESGLKCGKFISPNMIDVCERISIDGKSISQGEMDLLLTQVEKYAKEVEQEKGAMPTQFEIWTAAAFIYFAKEKCDIVVLETGLGGRLDATNIIDAPLLSIITKIDIDHIEYLGGTIEKIAAEKAGIIKKGSTVITTPNQPKEALSVLEQTAKEQGAEFVLASECVNYPPRGMSEIFDLGEFKNLKINLSGIHQTENASLAVKAAQLLEIEEKYIREGLDKARNIGRFEKISENPLVVFDGAHNLSGTEALTNAINRYFPEERISIIYAAMADKDIDASLCHLKENGFCERSEIFTVPVKDNPRAALPETLAEKFKGFGFDATPFKSIGEAFEAAVKENPVTLICGSLYLYKDFAEYIKEKS